MSKIQNTYYDALYFASASFNTKKQFAITPVQKDVLIKLIHYSTKNEVITWSSENIHQHTCIPVGSIDKAIQRLKQKGYIKVVNKQLSQTVVSRQITINWEQIETIDSLYNDWVDGKTVKAVETEQEIISPIVEEKVIEKLPIQNVKKEKSSIKDDLIKYIKKKQFNENDEGYLIRNVENGTFDCVEDIDDASSFFFKSTVIENNDKTEITM
jgi:DNA-binding MarR family transcriptional regulator